MMHNSVSSEHRCSGSLQIVDCQVLGRDPHLGFEASQRSNLVEIWGAQDEAEKTAPNSTCALHLRAATAPHEQRRPAEMWDAPGGVCGDVECTQQQV